MPWIRGNYELPEASIAALLELASLRPSDAFVDLGSGTGQVVRKAVELWDVKRAVGVEIDSRSRDIARRQAVRSLTKEQLERIDYWLGDIYSEDFDYSKFNVVYNSFEEEEGEASFYRRRFSSAHLKVVKKDLPLVGYAPSQGIREWPVWLFRMDLPLVRVRSKSEWASLVLDSPDSNISQVFDYFKELLSRRGISRKESALALNHLEKLLILRF